MADSSDSGNENAPTLKYWHVWTDDKGVSRQTYTELNNFKQESMGGDAAPQWNNHLLASATKILFSVLPVGWIGEWHENPKPQWIMPISGQWFVETMDGTRVVMGPGEVSFGADQQTQKDANGHKGHLSGTVGDEPAVLMIVQLTEDQWVAAKPDQFQS